MTQQELKQAVASTGSHFFDAETMRWFGSRLCGEPVTDATGAVWFVTSERDSHGAAWGGRRMYSVRSWNGQTIDTVGGFGAHATRSSALSAMRRLAGGPR